MALRGVGREPQAGHLPRERSHRAHHRVPGDRRPPRLRRPAHAAAQALLAASVAVLAAVTASCADERGTTAARRGPIIRTRPRSSAPRNCEPRSARPRSAAPAATVLRFWREIQLANVLQAHACPER